MAIYFNYFAIAIIVAVVAMLVAWKVLKWSLKKGSAVIQGLAALVLLYIVAASMFSGIPLVSNPEGIVLGFGLAGIGILFGAISNFLS